MLFGLFILGGCGKVSEKDIVKEFSKKVDNADSYYIEGTLDIVNNEDIYFLYISRLLLCHQILYVLLQFHTFSKESPPNRIKSHFYVALIICLILYVL